MTAWDALCRAAAPNTDRTIDERFVNADPARLRSLASAHGLLPAVAEAIDAERTDEKGATASVSDHRRQVQSGLHLTSELHAVLDALDDESIPAIPYKGPVLSVVAHGDLGTRQYVDVDVLVDPSAFDAATDVLRARGYEPVERLTALGEVALQNDDGATVDLHGHLLPRYHPATLAFEAAWDRRIEVDVGGREVPALSPADRIVVLAVHGTKHCWYRLGWVADVATLVDAGHADPDAVLARAASLRCRRHVLVACWLARECLGTELPQAYATAIAADPTVEQLGERALVGLRSGDVHPPEDGDQFAYQRRALDRRTDRVRYAVRLATIPSADDLASVDLPEWLSPLYRLVRPARLAARHGRRAVGRVR